MQGVEVTGMLIWSVFRDDDGPFRCYNSFGDDLKNNVPKEANGKLNSMAVSIVRDRIANFTIDEILKNRQKLRDGVKQEMQKLLTGWGMWLETCEIMDVKISSGSLFKNLQTEFREKSRMEAERIEADTKDTIEKENLIRFAEMSKAKTEEDTRRSIFKSEQSLKVEAQNGEAYAKSLAIGQKKKLAELETAQIKYEASKKIDKKNILLQNEE
jgi:hypothetical protein